MSVITDAAQLVKANSIQGNKMNDVDVVYTLWENLHKTNSMEVGQVRPIVLILAIKMTNFRALSRSDSTSRRRCERSGCRRGRTPS